MEKSKEDNRKYTILNWLYGKYIWNIYIIWNNMYVFIVITAHIWYISIYLFRWKISKNQIVLLAGIYIIIGLVKI